MMTSDVASGWIERQPGGKYEGQVVIERIDLSPIEAVYFKDGDDNYLWLKRKPLMEYDMESMSYKTRPREPRWEAYLKKQLDGDVVAYRGEFLFMHFKFSIVGVWDTIMGRNNSHRLNLYIERLPMSQQTIINGINERRRKS